METTDDRRKFARKSFPKNLEAKLLDGGVEFPCLVENVSLGGLCLKTNHGIPLGSFVRLALPTGADNSQVEIEGRLMWKREAKNSDALTHRWGLLVMSWLNKNAYEKDFDRITTPILPERRGPQRRKASTVREGQDKRNIDRRSLGTITERFQKISPAWDRFRSFHRYGRVIQSSSGSTVICHGKSKIMLGSNNYLGLTDHPKVKEAAIKATEQYGTGSGGSRVLSGSMQLHIELEEKLATFKGAEACHIYNSGYVANYATMTSLISKEDVVFNDQTNHASIIDGCRASNGVIRFYKHADCANLERKLAAYPIDRPKLIITDGVFSMDGDIAPLKGLYALAKRYNATLVVDDAHATGMIGATGRGTSEYHGLSGKVDVTIVTLSKSLAAVGGAVCGSKALIKYLFHRSRPFIFATALPPSVAATALAALEVIESEPLLLTNLNRNRSFFSEGLKKLGFNVIPSPTPIIPVIIGDEVKTYRLATMLDEMGVFVNAVSRPSVPRELSRVRVTIMATHTENQLGQALDAFQKAGRTLGII